MLIKNFIIETYKSKNCKDVNIYYYADKTVAIKDWVDAHNIIYIDADIMNKVIKNMILFFLKKFFIKIVTPFQN